MVDDVVQHFPEFQPVKPRHSCADADQHRAVVGSLRKAKVVQTLQVPFRHSMVALIDQDEFELAGVELADPVARRDGLYGGNGNVGGPRGLRARHFDLDSQVWVVLATVPVGLLNKLLAVDEDQGLGCVGRGRMCDPFDQLGEDDGFATPSGQRDAHAPVSKFNVVQNGLDTFFLIVSQLKRTRSGGSGQRTEGA